MPAVLLQIRTLGHSCKGNCICTRNVYGQPDINPECPVNCHTGEVRSVAFSPDGKRIASGSADKLVKIWNAATGVEVRRLLLVR